MIANWLRRRPILGDTALVALLLFLTIGAASRHDHPALGVALGVLQTLPLLVRRRRPVLVVCFIAAVVLASAIAGIWVVPLQLGVALYTLATVRPSREQRALAFASLAVVGLVLLLDTKLELGAVTAHVVFLVAA